MNKRFGMSVNQIDNKRATPLHFAVLHRECKNVELLIKLDADIDAQDFQGHTPLQIAIIRLSQEPDSFEDYKRIIKELLFNGASRKLKNSNGLTAFQLLEQCWDILAPSQFESLQIVLRESRPFMCFMRHRPLVKLDKSPSTLLLGVGVNVLVCFAFYYGLDQHINFLPELHHALLLSSKVLLGILVPTFILCSVLEPG